MVLHTRTFAIPRSVMWLLLRLFDLSSHRLALFPTQPPFSTDRMVSYSELETKPFVDMQTYHRLLTCRTRDPRSMHAAVLSAGSNSDAPFKYSNQTLQRSVYQSGNFDSKIGSPCTSSAMIPHGVARV